MVLKGAGSVYDTPLTAYMPLDAVHPPVMVSTRCTTPVVVKGAGSASTRREPGEGAARGFSALCWS